MAHNPDDPDASSRRVLLLAEAVPPSLKLRDFSKFGFHHELTVFTNTRKSGWALLAQWTAKISTQIRFELQTGPQSLAHDEHIDFLFECLDELDKLIENGVEVTLIPLEKPKPHRSATSSKGKAKRKRKGKSATTAESSHSENKIDEYSALVYTTAHQEDRVVQIIKPNAKPLKVDVSVRFPGHFEFSKLKIAELVGAVGAAPVPFERYCVFSQGWKQEMLEAINLTERGDYMLYSWAFLAENNCPGIAQWTAKVQASATCANSSDDDVQIVSETRAESSSSQTASTSRTASAAGSSRKRTRPSSSQTASTSQSASTAGPSRKRKRAESSQQPANSSDDDVQIVSETRAEPSSSQTASTSRTASAAGSSRKRTRPSPSQTASTSQSASTAGPSRKRKRAESSRRPGAEPWPVTKIIGPTDIFDSDLDRVLHNLYAKYAQYASMPMLMPMIIVLKLYMHLPTTMYHAALDSLSVPVLSKPYTVSKRTYIHGHQLAKKPQP
ncbi:hypothetical protein K438DRAFT_1771784 [Mycena galopus ATCC 62051]|nr:hypothetical protein K438DRAFT_1771784 [Mycena galopus ATCC 62051]